MRHRPITESHMKDSVYSLEGCKATAFLILSHSVVEEDK